MAGIKITLGTTFTDTTLPKLYPDAIMNDGSLMLVDMSNAGGWDYGTNVPVNGNIAGNLAWSQAATILGSGNRTTLSPVIANLTMDATGKIEFTGKKGLHVITSQTAPNGAGKGMVINLPAAFTAYMINNSTHKFYFSLWHRNTRIGLNVNEAHFALGGSTSHYMALMMVNGNAGITTGGGGSYLSNGANALGISHRVICTTGVVGSPSTGSTNQLPFGNKGWASAFTANLASSWILYKFYIEDLNVSGRTYAQVLALDQSLNAAAFAAGGQFYNDTYTDPATLP
jgi:hypothetical protein